MKHFPLIQETNERTFIEFSHFDYDAPRGLWKKENLIVWDYIKINVFVESPFSVFSDGVLHYPDYGDICVLSPMKMHYGQITEPMHINYYQFDIGREAFAGVPEGDRLIERLIEVTAHSDAFLRPDPQSRERVLRLCREIEEAIGKEERALAYAKIIEFLSSLYPLYAIPTGTVRTSFSLRISQITHYIEEHYAEHITREEIAEELGISPSFLSRIFKKELGITVNEYLNRYRILRSLSLLKDHSVTETGYLCGFCDNSHFISVFKKHMGETPLQYKNSTHERGTLL